MTPADELRAAAEKLRTLLADLGDNRGPWVIDKTATPYPQQISNVGVPYVVATTYSGPQGPLATPRWITTMHPGVGAAIADWLASFDGIDISEHAAMSDDVAHALTIARLINQHQETT